MLINRPTSTRFLGRRSLIKAGIGGALAVPLLTRPGRAQEQVTVSMVSPNASPAERGALEQLLDAFEAANPNIKVDYSAIPSDYDTKLQTDLSAGEAADVFTFTDLLAPDLMSREVLQPLDDLMAESGVTADQYYPSLLSAFQYNGATYGLPKDFSTLAMVYDPAALEAAGVGAPPTTWDELRTTAQALADADLPPIVYGPNWDRYIAFHYAAGAEIISEDGSQILINSPEGVAAMEFYYGLYRDGLVQSSLDVGATWPGDAFAQELASIVFEGPWMFGALEAANPDREFMVAEMPAGPGGNATIAFTVAYGLNARTAAEEPEVAQAAWQLINFLTGAEGMQQWTNTAILLPSRPDLMQGFLEQYPEFEPFAAGAEYAHAFQYGPGGAKFNSDANGEIEALFAEEQDVETTMANLQSRAEETIQLTS